MADKSHASVKRKARKKADSAPGSGVSTRSKKARKADKSSRTKSGNKPRKASTPARSPVETSGTSTPDMKSDREKKAKTPKKEVAADLKSDREKKAKTPKKGDPEVANDVKSDKEKNSKSSKKVDPEVLKAIKEGREHFVHIPRRGTKLANFTFPPGRIFKKGTDPKTVPIVPTTKMKDEMREMSHRTGKKKTKQRKYLADKHSKEKISTPSSSDQSTASRKKSRSNMKSRKKQAPITPK